MQKAELAAPQKSCLFVKEVLKREECEKSGERSKKWREKGSEGKKKGTKDKTRGIKRQKTGGQRHRKAKIEAQKAQKQETDAQNGRKKQDALQKTEARELTSPFLPVKTLVWYLRSARQLPFFAIYKCFRLPLR